MKGFPAVASGPCLAHIRLEPSSFFALMQFLIIYLLLSGNAFFPSCVSFIFSTTNKDICCAPPTFLHKICYLAKVGRARIRKYSFFFSFPHQSKFSSLYRSYLRTHMPMNTCKFVSFPITDTSLY